MPRTDSQGNKMYAREGDRVTKIDMQHRINAICDRLGDLWERDRIALGPTSSIQPRTVSVEEQLAFDTRHEQRKILRDELRKIAARIE
jgi:hypothetical protein